MLYVANVHTMMRILRMGKCILLENDMFHTGLGLSKRKGSLIFFDNHLLSTWSLFIGRAAASTALSSSTLSIVLDFRF